MKDNKQKYKQLFEIIRSELNALDPIGVVLDNNNLVDEYDLETQEIIPLITKDITYQTLAEKMAEIFIDTTSMSFASEAFYTCAKNIINKAKDI